jgi:hypothetical protein
MDALAGPRFPVGISNVIVADPISSRLGTPACALAPPFNTNRAGSPEEE